MKETMNQTSASADPLVYLSADFVRCKEYLEAILTATPDAICTTDLRGRVIYFSPGAEAMLGRKAGSVLGGPAADFYAGGLRAARFVMGKLLRAGTLTNHEIILLGAGGRLIHASLSAALLRDRRGDLIGTLGISKDITERVALERRLRELSITDELTGLFNSRHLAERLAAEIPRARRQFQELSVLMIDLDRFKQANDRWGHLAGDRLLRGSAGAIQGAIRRDVDSAFRLGGDEFAVLLPGSGRARAALVASRIQGAAAAKLAQFGVAMSLGAATLRPGETAEAVLIRADARMYEAKQARRGLGL